MTSLKKLEANRKNAKRSRGPKTSTGKNNSSRNARKHGFCSRELLLSEEEKAEFDTLRNALREQLVPATSLQEMAFEQVICCYWRCRLALRAEMMRLKTYLKAPDNPEAESYCANDKSVITRWYGADRQALRDGRRFLFQLRQEIKEHGGIRLENWKEQVVNGFGDEFYGMLRKWVPMNITAVRLAEMLVAHAETYGRPLPEVENDVVGKERVITDPELGWQMAMKLVELQEQHLENLARSYDQRRSSSEARASELVDFAPRYYTTAARDLHRALDWLLCLRGKRL